MQFIITFLEGLISFLSPCMLPMLPLYIGYFSGGSDKRTHTLRHALCFTVGFTLVFTLLGVFAGTLGSLLSRYRLAVRIVSGLIVIVLGLGYLEVLHLPFFKGMGRQKQITGMLSAFLFGVVYSVSLTPCVGAFLGSALMLASNAGSALHGAALLLCYSLGLGIPFLLSALLLDALTGAFDVIKRHYKVLNTVCGIFLILVGAAMALGLMDGLMLRLA
ncbi:MAG: cytochrome c biogenesis protein CcdA [Oscillospiraceae bacterium]|nr:cytochrome c biogenesis protein CcdA [Oscillospiraceae bacterium]